MPDPTPDVAGIPACPHHDVRRQDDGAHRCTTCHALYIAAADLLEPTAPGDEPQSPFVRIAHALRFDPKVRAAWMKVQLRAGLDQAVDRWFNELWMETPEGAAQLRRWATQRNLQLREVALAVEEELQAAIRHNAGARA